MTNEPGKVSLTDAYLDFSFDGESYLQVFAMMDNAIVGTAKVECWAKGRGYHPFVSKVWVHPEYRNQGIGCRVMNYIVEKAIDNENLTLALYVHKDNQIARRLYESLGFFAITIDPDLQILYAKQLS